MAEEEFFGTFGAWECVGKRAEDGRPFISCAHEESHQKIELDVEEVRVINQKGDITDRIEQEF